MKCRRWIFELQSKNIALARANEQLEHVAMHDPLTHLPNRILFNDRLEQNIRHGKRESRSFTVGLIDLNKFKEINDDLGHDVGDKVLYEAGERISLSLRTSDTIARAWVVTNSPSSCQTPTRPASRCWRIKLIGR